MEVSKCRRVSPGDAASGYMLYADDAGVVSQSPEQLRKMMGVIVVVCAAFSLTVSEANCHKWWPYILTLYLEPTYYIHTWYISSTIITIL